MIPIFVASNTSYAGRTFVSLGLALKLVELGYSVGYLKPIGKAPVTKGKGVYDIDALFIRETLGLADSLETVSPFVRTYENQTLLFEGRLKEVKKQVLAAFKTLKNRDFVIIGGASNLLEGSLLGMDAFALLDDLKARLVMVEPWRGEVSADSLYGVARLLGDRFIGGVINKTPVNAVAQVKGTVLPFLEKRGSRSSASLPRTGRSNP